MFMLTFDQDFNFPAIQGLSQFFLYHLQGYQDKHTVQLFRPGQKQTGIVNPVLQSGVTYLESLLLQALDWNILTRCLLSTSPSTHQQLRYHGDHILGSSCNNNSRAALLVSKILFHIHVLQARQNFEKKLKQEKYFFL